MERENAIKTKSTKFSLNVIQVYKSLVLSKEFVMSKQLLRSGTAIGALIMEAECAESRKDFIHKLSIAYKEANETKYWIYLLTESGYINNKELENDILEINRILSKIITTSKSKTY